jgi:hypothetical protein
MRRPGECVVSFGRLLAQSRRAAAATSGGFWVALGWLKWGVDNVHTVRLGPRRTALEPGRFPHVSGGILVFPRLECSSSPTSDGISPRQSFCFDVCTKLVLASL